MKPKLFEADGPLCENHEACTILSWKRMVQLRPHIKESQARL
jgi:hypothetical protein